MLLLSITGFLGRFHPVLVHLPIGFILLAIILDWKNTDGQRNKIVRYTWFLSAITASISALFGWFLANQGAYDNWTLFFHRWLGIAIAVVSAYAWWSRRNGPPGSLIKKLTSAVSILLLLVTGHLGGNMTHGSDYLLEYAPSSVQKLLGYNKGEIVKAEFGDPDSIFVYADLIYPIFEKKCISCHREDVQNGGLNMASIEAIKKGGDNGDIIVAGDLKSEVIRRVTLPFSSSKFMPTSGTPMTYHEIKILEWWISQGAEYEAVLTQLKSNPSVAITLLNEYNIDLTPRPWIVKTKVPAPSNDQMESLMRSGWDANRISQDNGWIEIIAPKGTQITDLMIKELAKSKDNITWVKLSESTLQNEQVALLNNLENITRLSLKGNDITSSSIKQLTNLKRLESLNLTYSKVDDTIFQTLDNFPSLRNIYLWETLVSEQALEEARKKYNHISIEHAANF